VIDSHVFSSFFLCVLIVDLYCHRVDNLWVLLNALPAMYHLAAWKAVREEPLLMEKMASRLSCILLGFLFIFPNQSHARLSSKQAQLLRMTQVLMPQLLKQDGREMIWKQELLVSQPLIFMGVMIYELLSHWSDQGVDTRAADLGHDKPATHLLKAIDVLPEDVKTRVAYIIPILHAYRDGAPLPKLSTKPSNTLLYGPLVHADRRCGYEGCRKQKRADGSHLYGCTGGCKPLEQYCGERCQEKDWAFHKPFCKSNRPAKKARKRKGGGDECVTDTDQDRKPEATTTNGNGTTEDLDGTNDESVECGEEHDVPDETSSAHEEGDDEQGDESAAPLDGKPRAKRQKRDG